MQIGLASNVYKDERATWPAFAKIFCCTFCSTCVCLTYVISQSIKKMASTTDHSCGLCVAPSEGRVDPSEWSYYALLICAVAAAWKVENPPRSNNPMQRLTALAARVVSEKCKFV